MISDEFEEYLKEYPAGRELFQEGDQEGSLYIIKNGLVGIFKETDDHREQITTASPGEVIGEMALLSIEQKPRKRSATAETLTEVSCWEFPKKQFDQLMKTSESFRSKILVHLVTRLRNRSKELARLRQAEERLYLLSFVVLKSLLPEQSFSSGRTIEIESSLARIHSQLGISKQRLKVFLSAPSLKLRNQLSEDLKQVTREVSSRIIEQFLSNFSVETAYEGEFAEETELHETPPLRSLCQRAEELNNRLRNQMGNLTRSKYNEFWEQYEMLTNGRDQIENQSDRDDTLYRRLKAYLQGLQKQFQSINSSNFNNRN